MFRPAQCLRQALCRAIATSASVDAFPHVPFPIFRDLKFYREWRTRARDKNKSVGFVATMGALHGGHLSLVRRSLAENDLTVLSIFVNPAQFAPHEDLTTYPRTVPDDLKLLAAQSVGSRTPSAVFLPTVQEMYPSGIVQDVSEQKGTFVEVKGYGHLMEGKSRPAFFRGVATVVTKLFNAIEPTNTYFGQKDIQQALLLRRMCRDLLLSHPSPEHLHIVPTERDPTDSLALSSRNAYLSASGRTFAPTLFSALRIAQKAWEDDGMTKVDCIRLAQELVESRLEGAKNAGVNMKLDYIEMNNPDTFEPLEAKAKRKDEEQTVLLSGALWLDNTRLIDNLIIGNAKRIFG